MLPELVLLAHLILVSPQIRGTSSVALASHSMSLENRYGNDFVNGVFKDNILLALNYTSGAVKDKEDVNWDEVRKPFHFDLSLNPGEGFAFDDKILPEYKDKITKTTNSHFVSYEGYKSDGWLIGDGVCHLASLIHWVAIDAGLTSISLRNHDFANIPEVPKEYGVSIMSSDANQNLYIINNLDKPVIFSFDWDGTNLTVSVTKTI